MNTNQQPILAAGLLSKLGELFFKGIDKVLDSAAQYEEEFGILKQVSRIPIADQNGKEYTLTIKLSPVKDKDGKFWVEAETNAPGLNVSSINKKVFDLNKKNTDDFNRMIDKMLEESNLAKTESTEQESEEQNSSEDSQNSGNLELQAEVQDIVDKINHQLNRDILTRDTNQNTIQLEVKLESIDKGQSIKVTITSADSEGADLGNNDETSFSSVNNDGEVISQINAEDKVSQIVEDYLTNNNLEKLSSKLFASTVVRATFIKSSKTQKVKLTSVTASRNVDIEDALDIAYDVASNADFVSSLGDEPESYTILETDDGYDVNRI